MWFAYYLNCACKNVSGRRGWLSRVSRTLGLTRTSWPCTVGTRRSVQFVGSIPAERDNHLSIEIRFSALKSGQFFVLITSELLDCVNMMWLWKTCAFNIVYRKASNLLRDVVNFGWPILPKHSKMIFRYLNDSHKYDHSVKRNLIYQRY